MFNELVKSGIEVEGRTKKYTWLPPTLRKYGEFVRWVQYKPYREALEQHLPKTLCDEILVECRSGKITEKVVPDDWPKDGETDEYLKEPKEEDLIEKKINIHLGSTCVTEQFFSELGLAKILQLGISINNPEIDEIKLDQEIDHEVQNKAILEIQNVMYKQEEEIEKNEPSPNQVE